jgi:heterotetrameric sarcosine oxidase gamma subunit
MDHDGWESPASFSSSEAEVTAVRTGVGLADLSHRAKFDSKTEPESHWWRLGAHRYLMIGERPLRPPSEAVDVTGLWTNLLLAGPRSKAVLAKLTSLNLSGESLPNLSCGQASVAHTHAIVLREDLNHLYAFHILVSREHSESVWEAILHAGHEFHLSPFGLTASRLLSA